jgi:hypothetical protein
MGIMLVIGSLKVKIEVTKHIAINFFKVGRLQLIFNLDLKLEVS